MKNFKVLAVLFSFLIVMPCFSQDTIYLVRDKNPVEIKAVDSQKTISTYLTIGISTLATVIVALALYIRKQHIKQLDMAVKQTEATVTMSSSLNRLTESINQHREVSKDLHELLITRFLK